MKEKITILPAYDHRHPDPEENKGIAGCLVRFDIDDVVVFEVQTNWHEPEAAKQFFNIGNWNMLLPFARSLVVEGREAPDELVDGLFQTLISEGSAGVFSRLRFLYERSQGVLDAEVVADGPVGPKLIPEVGE